MLLSVGILGILALYVLIYGTATHGTEGGGGGGGYGTNDHPQHSSSGNDAVSSHVRTIVEGDVIKSINPILKSGLENLIERGGKGSGGSKTTGGKGREPFKQAPTVSNAPGFYGGGEEGHWWDFMNRVVEEQVSNVDTGAHTSTETSTITSTDHPKPQAACPGYDEYWRKNIYSKDKKDKRPLSVY